MSLLELIGFVVSIFLFGFWILLTILHAKPRKSKELNRYHLFGLLIPSWNFFAPNPGIHDYYLLYRDQLPDGSLGLWRDISVFSEPRSPVSFLWNPQKLKKKALFDILMALVDELPHAETGHDLVSQGEMIAHQNSYIKLTLPYLTLVHFVAGMPRSSLCIARQFMVMRRSRVADNMEPLFISGLHSVRI